MRIHYVALAALFRTGCEDFDIGGSSDRYKEDFHYSYPLSAGGTDSARGRFNGSVDISGWDKNTVDYRWDQVRQHRGSDAGGEDQRDAVGEIRSNSHHTADGHALQLRSSIRDPCGRARRSFRIYTSSNGAIRIDMIEGHARLKTSNGAIHANQLHGGLDAHTSNGSVDVSDVSGETSLHTSNGSIRAEVKKGSFEARTSNGRITARWIEPDSRPVHLEARTATSS